VCITDELWLCPHAAYGALSYRLGAVEEARKLLDQAGGYETVLARIVNDEEERKELQRLKRQKKSERDAASVRYK